MSSGESAEDIRFPDHGPVTIDVADVMRWSAASWDFSPVHVDPAEAGNRGFDGPLVHGPWKAAMLRALVRRWLGEGASLTALRVRYHAADVVGEPLTFGGGVRQAQHTSDGAQLVSCELWVRGPGGTVTTTAEAEATIVDAGATALPLDRVRQAVRLGEDAGTFTYRIQSNDVERFAQALGTSESRGDRVATTYFGALDPVERRDLDLDSFLEDLPFPKSGGGNAFNEVTYERPLLVGDVITVTTRYTEVYEKPGSRGTLLFRVRVNEMRDAAGELVATSRCGHVLGYRLPVREVS